jgi:hypothetical protein
MNEFRLVLTFERMFIEGVRIDLPSFLRRFSNENMDTPSIQGGFFASLISLSDPHSYASLQSV